MIHTLRAWFGAALAAITSIPPRLRRRERVLTHDILSMQLAITAIIGTLAIVGLYGGGQWILQDNYHRWALQWT